MTEPFWITLSLPGPDPDLAGDSEDLYQDSEGEASASAQMRGELEGRGKRRETETEKEKEKTVRMKEKRVKVVLIDSPGFDDTFRSDVEVLEMIGSFLVATYVPSFITRYQNFFYLSETLSFTANSLDTRSPSPSPV
jgi:hypothetical protein